MAAVRSATRKFADFLKFANIFFRSIGIMPYEELHVRQQQTTFIKCIFFIGIINLNFYLINNLIYALYAFKRANGFIDAITAMSYVGFILVSETKVLCIWWQRHVLHALMRELQAIFPKSQQQQLDYQLEKYYRQCNSMTIGFSTCYMLLILIYNFYVLLQYLVAKHWLGNSVGRGNVPYVRMLLWDYEDNWSYYVVYATQVLGGFTSSGQLIASDLLLCALAIQLSMHYDYLSRRIADNRHQQVEANNMQFLKQIIILHNKLLGLSRSLNAVFSLPLLLNFMISSCVICFIAFLMTMGVATAMQMKLLFYLVCSLLQVYFICYLGQQLTDANAWIMQAVYNQNWLDADVKYKKMLLLIALRAQKPFVLRATAFLDVNRGTLTLIIQISYKFFTLLRAIYKE